MCPRACPFCQLGESSVEHWLCFCPCALTFFSIVLQQPLHSFHLIESSFASRHLPMLGPAFHTVHLVAYSRRAIGQQVETTAHTQPFATIPSAIEFLLAEHGVQALPTSGVTCAARLCTTIMSSKFCRTLWSRCLCPC